MRVALRRAALATLGSLLALDACGPPNAPDARWGSVVSQAQIVFMAPTGAALVPGGPGAANWELAVMDLDGSGREQVTHNTEQEFLPHFSPDGTRLLYTRFTAGGYGVPGSSDAWYPGKPARDLSLSSAPDCIEGVPKGSPDGARILLFRACASERFGVPVTDTSGSYRTWVADGFGPDWNPLWKP
ncbi:MAG: hypothetical protein Q8Q14_00790 [Gemmatimonadales bacterium]|nr:hypothetical protein [Gemmatimonadales bacterium]